MEKKKKSLNEMQHFAEATLKEKSSALKWSRITQKKIIPSCCRVMTQRFRIKYTQLHATRS